MAIAVKVLPRAAGLSDNGDVRELENEIALMPLVDILIFFTKIRESITSRSLSHTVYDPFRIARAVSATHN